MKDNVFERLREGIRKELLNANQHFKIYWALFAAPKEIADTRNTYLTYFYYAMGAHSNCLCLSICNVTNYDRQTSNLPRLLNYISSSKTLRKLFGIIEINDMKKTLASHKDLISRMETARNQYIAHNQLNKKHLGININYTHEEGEKLLRDLINIFNTLSAKYDANVFSFDPSPKLNVEQLLSDLTEHKQQKIGELKRLINTSSNDENNHNQLGEKEMNEYLKLHKALSEAEVEYQQKFDAVKNFELGLLSSGIDVPQTLKEWDRLKGEERVAYDKREAARKAYEECLKRTD